MKKIIKLLIKIYKKLAGNLLTWKMVIEQI